MADVPSTNTFPHNLTNGTAADADHVMANFNLVRNKLNDAGGVIPTLNDLDPENLAATLAALLGVSQAGSVRRGKSIVATEESRTNTAYGLMPTPDRVSGIVMPSDGVLRIACRAAAKESVADAAAAAIFIGSNQLRRSGGAVDEVLNWNATGTPVGTYRIVQTGQSGLSGFAVTSADVTTGQILGMELVVFVAAGTYDVSMQFKASSGSVTVKDRKLWVKAEGY